MTENLKKKNTPTVDPDIEVILYGLKNDGD